jgi:hypothetical protein
MFLSTSSTFPSTPHTPPQILLLPLHPPHHLYSTNGPPGTTSANSCPLSRYFAASLPTTTRTFTTSTRSSTSQPLRSSGVTRKTTQRHREKLEASRRMSLRGWWIVWRRWRDSLRSRIALFRFEMGWYVMVLGCRRMTKINVQ